MVSDNSEHERPYAVVTIADVYSEQRKMGDQLTTALEQISTLRRRQEDQETRVRKLEFWRYAIPATAVTLIVGEIARYLA